MRDSADMSRRGHLSVSPVGDGPYRVPRHLWWPFPPTRPSPGASWHTVSSPTRPSPGASWHTVSSPSRNGKSRRWAPDEPADSLFDQNRRLDGGLWWSTLCWDAGDQRPSFPPSPPPTLHRPSLGTGRTRGWVGREESGDGVEGERPCRGVTGAQGRTGLVLSVCTPLGPCVPSAVETSGVSTCLRGVGFRSRGGEFASPFPPLLSCPLDYRKLPKLGSTRWVGRCGWVPGRLTITSAPAPVPGHYRITSDLSDVTLRVQRRKKEGSRITYLERVGTRRTKLLRRRRGNRPPGSRAEPLG